MIFLTGQHHMKSKATQDFHTNLTPSDFIYVLRVRPSLERAVEEWVHYWSNTACQKIPLMK